MTKQQTLSVIAALAAGVSLSSCVSTWNIGKHMQDSATTYTGADTANPVGGVVYASPAGEFYMQAPEVTYQATTPVFTMQGFLQQTQTACDPDKRTVKNLQPTGRTVLVKVRGSQNEDGTYSRDVMGAKPVAVEALPAGCTTLRFKTPGYVQVSPGFLGELDTQRDTSSKAKTWGALPVKYIVDPLLTVTTNAAAYAVLIPTGAVTGLVSAPYFLVKQAKQTNELVSTAKKAQNAREQKEQAERQVQEIKQTQQSLQPQQPQQQN